MFPVPDVLVGDVPVLIGTDGKTKMSKSLGNDILLSDDAATVERRVRGMYTDPNRIHADIPGTVEGNPVFQYHDVFNPDRNEVEALKERYRSGTVGDGEVKERLTVALNAFLDPLRERREHFASRSGLVDEIIYEGTEKMRLVARETIVAAKKAMGLTGVWNRISRKAEDARKKRARSEGTVG